MVATRCGVTRRTHGPNLASLVPWTCGHSGIAPRARVPLGLPPAARRPPIPPGPPAYAWGGRTSQPMANYPPHGRLSHAHCSLPGHSSRAVHIRPLIG